MGAYGGVGARRVRIRLRDSTNVYRVRLLSSFQSPAAWTKGWEACGGFLDPTWRTLTPCGMVRLAACRRQVV